MKPEWILIAALALWTTGLSFNLYWLFKVAREERNERRFK